jgi:hypothetical protein
MCFTLKTNYNSWGSLKKLNITQKKKEALIFSDINKLIKSI